MNQILYLNVPFILLLQIICKNIYTGSGFLRLMLQWAPSFKSFYSFAWFIYGELFVNSQSEQSGFPTGWTSLNRWRLWDFLALRRFRLINLSHVASHSRLFTRVRGHSHQPETNAKQKHSRLFTCGRIHSLQVKANVKQKRHTLMQYSCNHSHSVTKIFSIGDVHRRGLRVHSYLTQKRIWKSAQKPTRNIKWTRKFSFSTLLSLYWCNVNKP